MAKRRRKRSSSRSGGLGQVSSLVRRAGMGMLGAMVVGAVADRFVPQYSGFARLGGAYMTGGAVGLAASLVLSGSPVAGQSANTVVTI